MTKADFRYEKSGLTVFISGEIDHHGARQIRDIIDTQIIKVMPRIVVLDFTNVTFMDSSGIGLVLARSKLCRDCGASLYVEGVDKSTRRILALAGIKTIQNLQV